MDTFDDLVHDICDAHGNVVLMGAMGPDYEYETRDAQAVRGAAIKRLHDRWDTLVAACEEALEEIAYVYDDLLTPMERLHSRGSGWARVHDSLSTALAEAKGD